MVVEIDDPTQEWRIDLPSHEVYAGRPLEARLPDGFVARRYEWVEDRGKWRWSGRAERLGAIVQYVLNNGLTLHSLPPAGGPR